MEDSDPRQQFEAFKQNDAYNQLLSFTEGLVTRVDDLSSKLEVATGDLEDQNAIRRDWKRRAEAAESAISKNPFILVLIDGDGYIFQDSYLKDGGSGGGDAAHQLLSEVQNCVHAARIPNLSSDYQIMVNVYANKRGLTGALLEAGIISHPNDLEEFFCKFTQSQTHFQFINCGSGKERVDAKLRDTYRLFLHNCQCRLIFLALSHDNGYIAELDKYRNNTVAIQKTLLIDHYARGRAFADPPFPMVKFDNVFSSKAVSTKRASAPGHITNTSSYSSALNSNSLADQTTRNQQISFSMPPPNLPPMSGTPTAAAPQHASEQGLFKDPSILHLAPGVEQPTSNDQIPVNSSNQRIDFPIHTPTPQEQHAFDSRITHHKLCNEHHLRGYCPDQNHCRFDHSSIDKDILNTLRYTARKIVCRSASGCRRADCYYGHQCPFPSCDARRCPFAKAGLHEVRDGEVVAFVKGVP